MRTLNRPMFRMGGPVKEGVMHGIREPKNMGGRMLLVGQHPKQFRDAGGREQHFAPVVSGILSTAGRFAPWAMRGIKSGWSKIKPDMIPRMKITQPSTSVPIGMRGRIQDRITKTPRTNWEMVKGFAQKNPWWTYGSPAYALSTEPGQAIAKGVGIGLPKFLAEAVTPKSLEKYLPWEVEGVESAWKDKLEKNLNINKVNQGKAKGVPGGGDEGMTYRDPEKAKKLAAKKRDDRVNNLLEIMGYDKTRKNAAYDALIDAGQIINQRGTLSKKNINRDLIDPIIAATSKRFDKPEQIREAVGLLMAKGEVEKDVAAGKGSTTMQTAKDMVATGASPDIEAAMKTLTKQSTMADTLGAIVAKGGKVGADEVEIALRIENPDIIPKLKIKGSDDSYKKWKDKNKGKTEMNFMEEIVTKSDSFAGPGVYIINKRAIVVDDQGNMAYEW